MPVIRMLAAVAAVAMAGGCLGGSAASPSSHRAALSSAGHRPYAVLHVRGTYVAGDAFGGDLRRARFTLTCRRPHAGGRRTWRTTLCAAILDYRSEVRLLGGPECNCPASPIAVDVRGQVGGRLLREHVTACGCGVSAASAREASVILNTHPVLG
jgi:hypothetical protein